MDALESFDLVKTAFPREANWQATHFIYAQKNGVLLIERKRFDPESDEARYFYWITTSDGMKLIHASKNSKFKGQRMKTVGELLTPSRYD